MDKRIELLSPAGSFDALKAAVNCGADAVYLGGNSFSARAFAKNFDHEELIEAVKYCHLRGVKVYLTLNTLLSENELDNALKEARFYYEHDVDALIIQDLGLYYRLKQELPDFPLHASTQMHIHNVSGVRNACKLGFSKVVLARESSLDLIKKACKEDIEIECFIHGAICVSYSGQCLMSSVLKHRSANKGMCAQCCRLRYSLYNETEKEKVKTDTEYLLSPKDMYLLEDIPDLIKAGVSSLKIEGRLKSPAYVGLVTSVYRKAIDSFYEGKEYHLTKEEFEDLLKVFNRGFTDSYLKNDDKDIFGNIRPNHMGKTIGKVIAYRNGVVSVKLNDSVRQFDGIRILNEREDTGGILNTITLNGKYVNKAEKGDIIEIDVSDKVGPGDTVVKTIDTKLEKRILDYKMKKSPIDVSLRIKLGEKLGIGCDTGFGHFEKEYDLMPEEARNAPLTKEGLLELFSKTDESPFYIKDFRVDMDSVFIVKSRLNEIRRDFYRSLEEFILNSFNRKKAVEVSFDDLHPEDTDIHLLWEDPSGNEGLKKDPVINSSGIYKNNDVCSEFGAIIGSQDRTAYYTLNVANSYAYELLNRLGFSRIILSTELTDGQIYDLIDAYEKRTCMKIRPYVFVYGKRALMYIRRNPFRAYMNAADKYSLKENDDRYEIRINDGFTEIMEPENHVNSSIDPDMINPFVKAEKKELKDVQKALNIGIQSLY